MICVCVCVCTPPLTHTLSLVSHKLYILYVLFNGVDYTFHMVLYLSSFMMASRFISNAATGILNLKFSSASGMISPSAPTDLPSNITSAHLPSMNIWLVDAFVVASLPKHDLNSACIVDFISV